eukprot:21299_1
MSFWSACGDFVGDVGSGIGDMAEGVGAGFASAGLAIAAGAVVITGDTETAGNLISKSGEYGMTFLEQAPIVSDGTDIVQGAIDGDMSRVVIGTGGLLLSVVTMGAGGQAVRVVAKPLGKAVGRKAARELAEAAGRKATRELAEAAGRKATRELAEAAGSKAARELTEAAGRKAARELAEDVAQQAAVGITQKRLQQDVEAWQKKVSDEMKEFDSDLIELYAKIAEAESLIFDSTRMSFAVKQLNVLFRRPGCSLILIAKQVAADSESKASKLKMKLPEKSFGLQVANLGLQSIMMVTMVSHLTGLSGKIFGKLKAGSKWGKLGKGMKRGAFAAQMAIVISQMKEQIDELKSQHNDIVETRKELKIQTQKVQYIIDNIKKSYQEFVNRLNELFPDKNLSSHDLDLLKQDIEIIVRETMQFEVDFAETRGAISAMKRYNVYDGVFVDYNSVQNELSPKMVPKAVYFAAVCGKCFRYIKANPKYENDELKWNEISDQFKSQNIVISTDHLKLFYKRWSKIYAR